MDRLVRFRMIHFQCLVTALAILVLTGCAGVSSGPGSNQSPNNGNGDPAAGLLAVSPATMSFGNVPVGSNSELTGTLTASTADVIVSSAAWNGTGYSVSGITFPVTVTAGSSVKYTVTFAPQVAGTSPGSISFTSNASDSSLSQTFAGDGATQGSSHSVALSWNPSTSSVIGYNVYRGAASGGPYAKINSNLDGSTSLTDNSVQSGQTYYYVTTAVDSQGAESSYSNQAQAIIPNP